MDVSQIISKVEIQKNRDETFSHTGKADHADSEGEVKTIGGPFKAPRGRSQKSINNSYT